MKYIIVLLISALIVLTFHILKIFDKFKAFYKKLNLLWKLFIWEVTIVASIVISGYIIQEIYIGGWGLVEKVSLVILTFLAVWIIVLVLYWALYKIKRYLVLKKIQKL